MSLRSSVLSLVIAVAAVITFVPTAQAAPVLTPGGAVVSGSASCPIGFLTRSSGGGVVVLISGGCGQQGTVWRAGGIVVGTQVGADPYGYARVPVGSPSSFEIDNGGLTGATQSAIGSTVCTRGGPEGTRCGSVQAKNQTIAHSGGYVYGLTRTNICLTTGSSGRPIVAGTQAQGIVIGGSGTCSSGGATYFLPVTTTLGQYGLSMY